MIRHVVMFRFHDEVTAENVVEFSSALSAMVPKVPGIVSYEHGPDLGANEGNHDYVVTADFESLADQAVYRDHPAHRAVIERFTGPMVAARTSVQFTLGS